MCFLVIFNIYTQNFFVLCRWQTRAYLKAVNGHSLLPKDMKFALEIYMCKNDSGFVSTRCYRKPQNLYRNRIQTMWVRSAFALFFFVLVIGSGVALGQKPYFTMYGRTKHKINTERVILRYTNHESFTTPFSKVQPLKV